MTRLRRHLTTFRRDTAGSMPIEGLMGVLLLLGWFAISFQFYDAFRMKGLNTKAAYTIADLISREEQPVGPKYVDGMQRVFDFLTSSGGASWIRVSSIYFDGDSKSYKVSWSHATGGKPVQTNATINSEKDRIPTMPVGDTAILVETSYLYDPLFSIGDKALSTGATAQGPTLFTRIGLPSNIRFSGFVVTRPRGPRIMWDASS